MSRAVLHVAPSFAPAYVYGGPTRSLEGLAVEQARAGQRVEVLSTDANGAERLDVPGGWTTWRGVPTRYLRRWLKPDIAPALFAHAVAAARRAEVVHVHALFSVPSALGLLAARVAGRPVVFSPRGALESKALEHGASAAKARWIKMVRPLLRDAVVHATSDKEAASAERALGPRCVVRVVPNGTDLEPIEAARARRARCLDRTGPRVIAAMGRIHPIKGLDLLVRAFAILPPRARPALLRVAGPAHDADHARELAELARSLGVADRVHFAGTLEGEAKLDFLASSEVFCLPSHSENFGNVVVEALASLTPVVAAQGTPWQLLERERAGRWVRNDPPELARALDEMLSDPDAAAFAERGRALVERSFTWRAVAEQMNAAYETAVTAASSRQT